MSATAGTLACACLQIERVECTTGREGSRFARLAVRTQHGSLSPHLHGSHRPAGRTGVPSRFKRDPLTLFALHVDVASADGTVASARDRDDFVERSGAHLRGRTGNKELGLETALGFEAAGVDSPLGKRGETSPELADVAETPLHECPRPPAAR
jgi:hypothetical protein